MSLKGAVNNTQDKFPFLQITAEYMRRFFFLGGGGWEHTGLCTLYFIDIILNCIRIKNNLQQKHYYKSELFISEIIYQKNTIYYQQ